MRLLFICTSFVLAAQSASAQQAYSSRIAVQAETRVIVQRGDTAWFIPIAQSPHYPLTHAVGYLKSSGKWIEGLTQGADPHNIEREMPAGLVLEQTDTAFEAYWAIDIPVYTVRDTLTGAATRLMIPNTDENRRKVISADVDTTYEMSVEGFSTKVTRWVADRDHIWFGMWAGVTDLGDIASYRQRSVPEWIGGIIRYDIKTRATTPLLHPGLRMHWVADLALTPNDLWIAAQRFDRQPYPSKTGLLRHSPADSTWRIYTHANSPLPGNTVDDLDSADELLFIVADSGLAAVDTRNMSWDVRWFDVRIQNDSIITVLLPARPRPDTLRDAVIYLARMLQERNVSALLEAAKRVPQQPFAEVVICEASCDRTEDDMMSVDTAAAALAHPSFIPFLRRAFDIPDQADTYGYARELAIEALARIGDAASLRVLRTAFAGGSVLRAVDVAERLIERGDTVAGNWLGRTAANFNKLDDSYREHLLDIIVKLGTLPQQRTLARQVESNAQSWSAYLRQFAQPRSREEPVPGTPYMSDPQVRASVIRIARTALTRPDTALLRSGIRQYELLPVHYQAIEILARWGRPSDVAILIHLFEDPLINPFEVAYGLALLTGVDSGPKADRTEATSAQRQALSQFWTEWWRTHGPTFRFPPEQDRVNAVLRWLTRHGLPLCC